MDSPELSESSTIHEVPIPISERVQKRFFSLLILKDACSRIAGALSIKAIWERMAIALEATPEPQIQQKYDCDGWKIWEVYDPITRRSLTFRTEAEFQVWYEQRYRTSRSTSDLHSASHTWRRWNR
jgi:hypothetical protein